MLSCSRSTVSLNKLYLCLKQRANFDKNLITSYACSLCFSTSPNLLTLYDKGTKANMTQEKDINELFLKNIKKIIKDPKLFKQGLYNFIVECRKFFKEYKDSLMFFNKNFEWQDRTGEIEIVFKFETEKEIDRFVVNCDSAVGGYSTAQFELTKDKTGLFYGTLSTDVPKHGDIIHSGYTNIFCVRPTKSFGRPAYFDWSCYTHLVLKVRGDGRTYSILLSTPDKYNHTWNDQFTHPLYTRGGPYWQITKIPLSHFIMSKKTRIHKIAVEFPKTLVSRLGITLSDSYDGPFKLEIDYIGLEKIPFVNENSPYETYEKRESF